MTPRQLSAVPRPWRDGQFRRLGEVDAVRSSEAGIHGLNFDADYRLKLKLATWCRGTARCSMPQGGTT
jgi:hypothetical protein